MFVFLSLFYCIDPSFCYDSHMDTKQQFLTEFKALLEKYDIAIVAKDNGCMAVYERPTGQTFLFVPDWEINFRDIKA